MSTLCTVFFFFLSAKWFLVNFLLSFAVHNLFSDVFCPLRFFLFVVGHKLCRDYIKASFIPVPEVPEVNKLVIGSSFQLTYCSSYILCPKITSAHNVVFPRT